METQEVTIVGNAIDRLFKTGWYPRVEQVTNTLWLQTWTRPESVDILQFINPDESWFLYDTGRVVDGLPVFNEMELDPEVIMEA